MKIRLLPVILLILLNAGMTHAQTVWQHTSHQTIYDFLDEMANIKYIEINSAVKPYSRNFIAGKLLEVNYHISKLNKRQKKELEFFLKEYTKEIRKGGELDYLGRYYFGMNRLRFKERSKRPDLFYYNDSVFSFTLNPIIGVNTIFSDSGMMYHRWNGAGLFFYAGSHLGVYASLRDNYLSKAVYGPDYLVQETGGGFKEASYGFSNRDAVEYSEMRGGITVGGKWWNFGLIKDHLQWGNHYNGANIFSDRAPSFARINLQLKPSKWLELNYFHGWLSSKVIDSTATQVYGTGTTNVYVPKYIAANFLTIKPIKNLHFSIGNSIIYSRTIQAGYLIPIMFFKSLDHTYSTLGNSQMFIDISSRNLKHVHFYFTGYFDDFSFARLFDDHVWKPWSFKGGIRASGPLPNMTLTAEYTRNNVLVYKHFNPETTFESTRYNMGHYLRDNATEWYFSLSYKPFAKVGAEISYLLADKGPEYPDLRNQYDPVTGEPLVYTYPFQEKIIWKKSSTSLAIRYEPVNDLIIKGTVSYSDIKDETSRFTPGRFQGKQLISSLMMTFGF